MGLNIISVEDSNGNGLPVVRPTGATQSLSIGTVVNTTNYSDAVLVRVAATADCHFKIGVNAVATTSDPIFKASYEYFIIKAGERLSVIDVSGGSGVLLL